MRLNFNPSVPFNRSDNEIIAIVDPMIDEVVAASNKKDWKDFSKHQTEEEANDPNNRKRLRGRRD